MVSLSLSLLRTFDLNIIMSIQANDTTNSKTQQRQVIWRGDRRSQMEIITRCDGRWMKEDLLRVERYKHQLYSLLRVNISTASYQRKRKNVFILKILKLNFIFILLMLLLSNPFFSQNIFLKFKVGIKSEFWFLLWIIFNIYI